MKSLETGKSYLRFFRVRPYSSMKSVFENKSLVKELVKDIKQEQKPTLVIGITAHVLASLSDIRDLKHLVKHFLMILLVYTYIVPGVQYVLLLFDRMALVPTNKD